MLAVLPAFAASRMVCIAVTLAVAVIRARSPVDLWNVLDAQWYIGIAIHGYGWSLDGKPSLAFFPLYPLLIHLAVLCRVPPVGAALLVANTAALGAFIYLHRLTDLAWDRDVATRAVWLTSLFPTAFFTFAAYSEALFMLCAAAALYHAAREQAGRAGLWLAAALLTRSMGVILILPVLMMTLGRSRRSLILAVGPGLVASAGYTIYLLTAGLHPSMLLTSQRHWHRSLTWPWTGFTASLHYLANHFTYNAGWTAENMVQLAVTIVCLGATVVAWRFLLPPLAVYCAGFWVVVLCTPEWMDGYFAPFSSVDRFVLALLPLMGWAAACLPDRLFRPWLVLSGTMMACSAAVHLAGGWVG